MLRLLSEKGHAHTACSLAGVLAAATNRLRARTPYPAIQLDYRFPSERKIRWICMEYSVSSSISVRVYSLRALPGGCAASSLDSKGTV